MSEMKNKLSNPERFDEITKNIGNNNKGGQGIIGFKDGRSFVLSTFSIQDESDETSYVWNFHNVSLEVKLKKERDELKEKSNQLEKLVKNRTL